MILLLLACSGTPEGHRRLPPLCGAHDPAALDTASDDTASDDTASDDTAPDAPAALSAWLVGDDADADVTPAGPGLILMGGGTEPDAAFTWWVPLLQGGDVVVLRASGTDGYNDYLYTDIGGVDSVQTLLVDTVDLAQDPYVSWKIDHAEGVFIAGGDQWVYLSTWSHTALQAALQRVLDRGAVLGGTSAGLAILGDRVFSAQEGTVYSDEALTDPYNAFMLFQDDFLDLADLSGVITDSHFRQRDRMGRLVGFVARMWADGFSDPRGVGVDESTALLIGPDGQRVVGSGAVYTIFSDVGPELCQAGRPLEWSDLTVIKATSAGETTTPLSAHEGALFPSSPY